MITIWKFNIDLAKQEGTVEFTMPEGAMVLPFAVCQEPHVVSFYAQLDNEKPFEQWREFQVVGTGQPIGDLTKRRERPLYVASCTDGEFVWHLIEWR